MPPLNEIIDVLISAVLPSAVAAFVVFISIAKFAPRKFAIAAGAFAFALGFLAGNHLRGAAEFRLDSERVLTPRDLGRAFVDTFVPPTNEDAPLPPPVRYWLPWSVGLALVGGVFTHGMKPAIGWPIRIILAGLAASLAIPPEMRTGVIWSVPVLVAIIVGEWFVLERLAWLDDERMRLVPPFAGAFVFLGASIVLLHAHTARFVDIATIIAASLVAIVAGAWLMRTTSNGVIPGIAVALPCLMLSGHQDTFSSVPTSSFALAATAPLALAPLLIPRVRRLRTPVYGTIGVLLLTAPVMAAVILAVMHETLSFE